LIYRLLILFALLLAGVAVWLTLAPRQSSPAIAQANRPSGPDQGYEASDASVVQTGADGLPMYTLQARRAQQDPASDIINLTTVHMTFNDSQGGRWQARSDHAQVRRDSAQIDLSGAIDVTGRFARSDQPVHFLTETLHIDTRTDMLQTRSAVTLDWSGKLLNARGMVTYLKDHRVKLESQVHGHFVP
jgi:LPS export ABC transporter protein LptC